MNNHYTKLPLVLLVVASMIGGTGTMIVTMSGPAGSGETVLDAGSISSSAMASLPSNATIPAGATITLVQGTENKTFTLLEIWQYVDNGTIYLHNYTYPVSGTPVEAKGINPLQLMELAGWADPWTFSVVAGDGFNRTFNVQDYILRDFRYNKFSSNNASMLCIAVGVQWLQAYDATRGHFMNLGDGFTGQQRIRNVTTITYESSWVINVKVDGQQRIAVGYNNLTTFNHTSYAWGYNANFSWPQPYTADVTLTGVTVASIIAAAINETTQNYTVNLIAADGYGMQKTFTKTQIENGFTGDMVTNGTGEDELLHGGRQAMLAVSYNGESLRLNDGAFWLIAPGAQKGNYIKQVIEILVTTVPYTPGGPETPEGEPPIDGFLPFIVLLGIAAAAIPVLSKVRKHTE